MSRTDFDRLARANSRRRQRARREGLRNGTWRRREPAQVAIDHIARLRAAGLSVKAIAEAAGLAPSILAPYAWPTTHAKARKWILPATLDAIMTVQSPAQAPDWAHVSNVGTRRRIEGLQVMGWPQSAIADRLGVSRQAVSQMKAGPCVTAENARRIAAIYDDLSMRPGPDKKTRTWALRAGCVPPLAWDDDTIDDPHAQPTGAGYVEPTPVEHVLQLVSQGMTQQEIADVRGVTREAVRRMLVRAQKRGAA